MLELTVDLLNPTVVRFQMMVGAFIALLAIFFTILKAMMAEREEATQKKIMREMAEYKEEVRREEAKKRQKEQAKWEEGEEWPIRFDEDGKKKRPKKKDGGGRG